MTVSDSLHPKNGGCLSMKNVKSEHSYSTTYLCSVTRVLVHTDIVWLIAVPLWSVTQAHNGLLTKATVSEAERWTFGMYASYFGTHSIHTMRRLKLIVKYFCRVLSRSLKRAIPTSPILFFRRHWFLVPTLSKMQYKSFTDSRKILHWNMTCFTPNCMAKPFRDAKR